MKLTEEQINVICHYTDEYRIDRQKLMSYLEKHRIIKGEVFGYCTKVSKKNLGARGYCMYLEEAPMYTPVDREIFIRRIPFYFYQMPMGGERRSGLSLIIPLPDNNSAIGEDYDAFYADLEWMLYDLGIPIGIIFTYAREQVAPMPKPEDETAKGMFPIKFSHSAFQMGGLNGRDLFRSWRHYLHLCAENGLKDLTPARFITAYNEALVKVGKKPIIYYPVKDFGTAYIKDGSAIVCNGHFPCDGSGKPIFEWTSILVKRPAAVSYNGERSRCGELCITLGPKTIVYVLDDDPEDGAEPRWQQLYAGPQTMEFDNDALRNFRKAKNMTQSNVADAIGTSVRTYQKWESGETTPDGHYLLRLMNWLDIDTVQSLVKYIDPPDSEGG